MRVSPLQVGEVWEEVRRELSLDGVRPTTPDEEALSTIHKTAEDTARKVTAEQNGIVEQREKQELSEEELMYTEVLGVSFSSHTELIRQRAALCLFFMS